MRIRPRTIVFGAAGLVAAGLLGGWLGATHLRPEHVAYTKGVTTPIATRPAPPPPEALQARLEKLAEAYKEPVGIAVSDVTTGWTAKVAADAVYPQQSVCKLWVALAVMQAVDDGRLSLDQQVILGPEDRSVFYQPLTARIRGPNGIPITIADLLRHALIESDNSANDKLVSELGGAQAVMRVIAAKRLHGVAVGGTERDMQTRTAGLTWKPEYGRTWIFKTARAQLPDAVRDQALASYLADPPDGATPDGIVTALAALKRGELLSRASTDFMLGLMEEARTGAMRLHAAVPRGWTLAHKTGTGPDWRGASVGINDVGLLTAPDGHTYAVAVMIRQTSRPPSAQHAIMQNVVRAIIAQWSSQAPLPAEGHQVAASQGVGAYARGF